MTNKRNGDNNPPKIVMTVSEIALVMRVRRALAAYIRTGKDMRLTKHRGSYYLMPADAKSITRIDLEEYARQIGVLKPYEGL